MGGSLPALPSSKPSRTQRGPGGWGQPPPLTAVSSWKQPVLRQQNRLTGQTTADREAGLGVGATSCHVQSLPHQTAAEIQLL